MEKSSKSARANVHGPMKRKRTEEQKGSSDDQRKDQQPQKHRRPRESRTAETSLSTPHNSIVTVLAPKYDVLTASVISSTRIHNRIVRVTEHIRQYNPASDNDQGKARPVVLLHARPREACKLITVVEQCKRILKKEGRPFYQYNQLFDLPPEAKKPEVVEATVLQDAEDEESEDDFEVMGSRFEQAIQPPPDTKVIKSLRIFIAPMPVPELKQMSDVTLQAVGGN
ncbi:unnamed protein product [Clonostachys rosea]|uniref:DNA/RNA-binding protein Alba-like domain-containing protein n=1 Tax=Bionectria ochroleuca TaxID=29856 RepID=A0ABY6V1B9_BIOOC|nr:unnamed protein product [Clonostachys rosea]